VDRNLKRKEKQTKVKHWTCETMPDQYRSYSNVLPFRCAFGLGFTFLILLILSVCCFPTSLKGCSG
jgi:hypothetical protein